jgi:hypothetical protein
MLAIGSGVLSYAKEYAVRTRKKGEFKIWGRLEA